MGLQTVYVSINLTGKPLIKKNVCVTKEKRNAEVWVINKIVFFLVTRHFLRSCSIYSIRKIYPYSISTTNRKGLLRLFNMSIMSLQMYIF
jgi:hypothetical protein